MDIRQLAIGLHNNGNIVIQSNIPESIVAFNAFPELLGVAKATSPKDTADAEIVAVDQLPAKRHTLKTNIFLEAAYTDSDNRFLVAGLKEKYHDRPYYYCRIWQAALICADINALLRGEKAILCHGAALETKRGAVLIFGESGMGKSTAAKRWREYGGKCISDDMVLLDFSAPEIFVRRMPTWSACRESRNLWNYPSQEEIPLAGVIALGRSDSGHDEIVPVSMAQFFAQSYRSLFYWILPFAKELPAGKENFLVETIKSYTEIITGRFAPRALLAALEGDLLKFLEQNL